jgi:hypothetical protein
VQGVECSNHFAPTKFTELGILHLRSA